MKNLTPVATNDTVSVPVDGADLRTAASVETPLQNLTNRTEFLRTQGIQKVATLVALKALTPVEDDMVFLDSISSGAGMYVFNSGVFLAGNDVTIVTPDVTPGSWLWTSIAAAGVPSGIPFLDTDQQLENTAASGNKSALKGTGHGTAAGVEGVGGATGDGGDFTGGATSGKGITALGKGAEAGIEATGGSTDGSGGEFLADAGGDGTGAKATGYGSGAGLDATCLGATGHGVLGSAAGSGTGVAGASNTGLGMSAQGDSTSNPPAKGVFRVVPQVTEPTGAALVGEMTYDLAAGKLKVCTVAGTPGTWVALH